MISDEIIPVKQLNEFLQNLFPGNIDKPHFIAKGVFSQAFSFCVNSVEYIIRIGSSEEGFLKDDFAFQNFSSPEFPIPEILRIDKYDQYHFYCISKKMPGKTMQELSFQEEQNLIPILISSLDHLRNIPVPFNTLFGTLNEFGQGQFKSWRAFITNFSNWEQLIHKGAHERFSSFEHLFDTTFLDPNLCRDCKTAILELAPFCPEEKYYVHGDFGFGNLVTDGKKITGILDWAELLCGDFLVDIAALDYGRDTDSFSLFFQQYCHKKNIPVPHFEQRLRCYKIIMALKSMYLEANRNQREWYEEEVDKLNKLGIS